MTNIAIVGGFAHHLECVGFLCECVCSTANVHIYFIDDPFRYLTYFKTLFPQINLIKMHEPYVFNFDNYKCVIKLTSNDPIFFSDNENIISILHIKEHENYNNKFITLSPYVKSKKLHIQLFPVYNGLHLNHTSDSHKPYILFIGYFIEAYMDADFLEFANHVKKTYQIVICTSCDCKFLNNTEIKYLNSPNTQEIVEHANKSKFVLCRKLPYLKTNIFSGALSFGISHNLPLIINDVVATDNKIEYGSITFKKNYCETLDTIMNIDDCEYSNMVNLIELNKKRVIQENTTCFNNFFSKTN